MQKKKVLLFCLDGASWNVINPLLKSNSIPNFQRLLSRSSWGVLESCDPLISAVLWTSIISGKSPDQHGIHSFLTNSESVRCKRLWDIFKDDGLSIGLYGFLLTWPPYPLKGFIVPGFLAGGTQTFPENLSFIKRLWIKEKVNRKTNILEYLRFVYHGVDNGLRLKTIIESGWNVLKRAIEKPDYLSQFYKKRILGLKLNTDIYLHLLKKVKPEFTCFYTNVIDACSHNYWKFAYPDGFLDVKNDEIDKFKEVIKLIYQEVDNVLGRILSVLDKDTIVLVLSDHGFKPNYHSNRRLSLIKTDSLLEKLGMSRFFEGMNIALKVYFREKDSGTFQFDNFCALLKKIKFKKNDKTIFNVSTDTYSNVICELSYKDIYEEKNDVLYSEVLFPDNRIYKFKDIIDDSVINTSGMHDKNGVLILQGKNIKQNYNFGRVSIYDVVPTILALIKKPVAKDMAGNPIVKVFRKEFIKNNPVMYIETYEDEKIETEKNPISIDESSIHKELEELGYIY
jgi:predicted AlkP superfamily phosphohydrolase/phosphomutase